MGVAKFYLLIYNIDILILLYIAENTKSERNPILQYQNQRKTVIVTGGGRGIGAAVCRRFCRGGYNVMIHYNTSERDAAALKMELTEQGGCAEIFGADLRDPTEARRLVSKTLYTFGNIDVLVNNAGISQTGLFSDTRPEDYAYVFDSNVKTAVFMTKEVLQPMLAQARGTVINISSVWGVCGGSLEVLYSASKAALIGFTKALAKELSKSGIRVSCVAPGVVDTAMFSCYDEQTQDEIRKEIPLGYVESPENIAESVYFLCTDAGAYYHGQTLNPNGGFAM